MRLSHAAGTPGPHHVRWTPALRCGRERAAAILGDGRSGRAEHRVTDGRPERIWSGRARTGRRSGRARWPTPDRPRAALPRPSTTGRRRTTVDARRRSPSSGARRSSGRARRRPPGQLRVDFGAHFEANYQRLVAQLYAITLDAGRGPRRRAGRLRAGLAAAGRRRPDRRPERPGPPGGGALHHPQLAARARPLRASAARGRSGRRRRPAPRRLLSALGRLPPAERRAVVLTYMAGCSIEEIAARRAGRRSTVQARLSRGRPTWSPRTWPTSCRRCSAPMADVRPRTSTTRVRSDDEEHR